MTPFGKDRSSAASIPYTTTLPILRPFFNYDFTWRESSGVVRNGC